MRLRVHLRRARLQRRARIEDPGQRLVVHLDRLGRVARLLERLRRHQRHRLPLVPDPILGEDVETRPERPHRGRLPRHASFA